MKDKFNLDRKSIYSIILILFTIGFLVYLIKDAGLDLKGIGVIAFGTLTFFLLIKMRE
ncbi:hypothetical protein NIES4071_110080 (plasmid) [Calothrix sp. NIES-4071]|nr:hypothetical protein NIES4071_110080 [Calothrix sp. NIES-4071]